MPEPLSPDAYVDESGLLCPACKGSDLARGRLDSVTADTVTRRWACEDCGATWTAVYTLTWYDDLHVPTDEKQAQ